MHHIEGYTSAPKLHAGINKKTSPPARRWSEQQRFHEPQGSRESNQHERHERGERSADTRAGAAERERAERSIKTKKKQEKV